jgi:hypothetical protein
MIVLQRFECKPNVRHGAPAAQQTGTPPAKKVHACCQLRHVHLLVVQQWRDRRDVGRRFEWKLLSMVCARTLGSKSAETAVTDQWRDRHNGTHGTSERNEATRPSQAFRCRL